MPEFTWDHTHIKTYDVPGTAAWLQDKLGASSVQGTTASEARADLLIGGTKVIVTQVKQGDGTNPTPAGGSAGYISEKLSALGASSTNAGDGRIYVGNESSRGLRPTPDLVPESEWEQLRLYTIAEVRPWITSFIR